MNLCNTFAKNLQNILQNFCRTFAGLLLHFCNFCGTFAKFAELLNFCRTFGTFADILEHLQNFWNICRTFGTFAELWKLWELWDFGDFGGTLGNLGISKIQVKQIYGYQQISMLGNVQNYVKVDKIRETDRIKKRRLRAFAYAS